MNTTLQPLKILIAEDDPRQSEPLRRLILNILGKKITTPIEIKVVTTLREVLEHTFASNATILDLNLEDAGEEEVLAAIHLCREPVIVLTGNDDGDLHARCRMNGADYVFVKLMVSELELCRAILHSFNRDLITEANV